MAHEKPTHSVITSISLTAEMILFRPLIPWFSSLVSLSSGAASEGVPGGAEAAGESDLGGGEGQAAGSGGEQESRERRGKTSMCVYVCVGVRLMNVQLSVGLANLHLLPSNRHLEVLSRPQRQQRSSTNPNSTLRNVA